MIFLYWMKKLNLKQMENVQGGASPKECFYRGVGITLTASGGFIFAPLWGEILLVETVFSTLNFKNEYE